jgi:hypothetical protein
MAIGTHYVVHRVGGTPDVRPRKGLVVATQAIIEDLLRLQLGESDDRFLVTTPLNMCFSGAVTALAAGSVGWLLTGSDALKMWILVELKPDIRMTRFAHVAADISGWKSRCAWGYLLSLK